MRRLALPVFLTFTVLCFVSCSSQSVVTEEPKRMPVKKVMVAFENNEIKSNGKEIIEKFTINPVSKEKPVKYYKELIVERYGDPIFEREGSQIQSDPAIDDEKKVNCLGDKKPELQWSCVVGGNPAFIKDGRLYLTGFSMPNVSTTGFYQIDLNNGKKLSYISFDHNGNLGAYFFEGNKELYVFLIKQDNKGKYLPHLAKLSTNDFSSMWETDLSFFYWMPDGECNSLRNEYLFYDNKLVIYNERTFVVLDNTTGKPLYCSLLDDSMKLDDIYQGGESKTQYFIATKKYLIYRIYREDDSDHVNIICRDINTGRKLWFKDTAVMNPGASRSGTIKILDNNAILTVSNSIVTTITNININSGELVWSLKTEGETFVEEVVYNRIMTRPMVSCIDLKTGITLWRIEGKYDHYRNLGNCLILEGRQNVKCINIINGQEIWNRTFENVIMEILYTNQEKIIIGEDIFTRCYSTANGNLIWENKAERRQFFQYEYNFENIIVASYDENNYTINLDNGEIKNLPEGYEIFFDCADTIFIQSDYDIINSSNIISGNSYQIAEFKRPPYCGIRVILMNNLLFINAPQANLLYCYAAKESRIKINSSENIIHFETFYTDHPVQKQLTLTNHDSKPLSIGISYETYAKENEKCFNISDKKFELKPGEKKIITIEFQYKPEFWEGFAGDYLSVSTNEYDFKIPIFVGEIGRTGE